MTQLDIPTTGNMPNKYAAEKRMVRLEDALPDLRDRPIPPQIIRYKAASLQPEYPNIGEFHD